MNNHGLVLSSGLRSLIGLSLIGCLERLKKNRYVGHDPADLLNTSLPGFKRLPGLVLRTLTVINARSPVNLRPLLRIQPATNTTALAILGRTCVNLSRNWGKLELLVQARELAERLLELSSVHGDTMGWSRIINYQAKTCHCHSKATTLTFINACVIDFFLDLYEATTEVRYLTLAKKVCKHLLCNTVHIDYPFGICLSYIDKVVQEIPNASILAGAALNRFAGLTGDEQCLRVSLKVLDYALYRQSNNGSWFYSYHFGKNPKSQFDFHQCYMLDGIKRYTVGLDQDRIEHIHQAFDSGKRFYCDKMFDKAMYPLWRYPRKYPIDVHNVSHAVYFFARYLEELPRGYEKLERLLSILMYEFYDSKDYRFYYQRYPFLLVKHNFFRWNTAWSLYALSQLPHCAVMFPGEKIVPANISF